MIAWYIVPYRISGFGGSNTMNVRTCEMDDYTPQIRAAGGQWTETEILGNRAIVKVRATPEIITTLNARFKRIPKDRLDDPLSDLSTAVKQAIKDEILDMGYSLSEIQERFPQDLGKYTLRDVLRFMARRRLKPRYDEARNQIYLDGPAQECRAVESVDAEVTE